MRAKTNKKVTASATALFLVTGRQMLHVLSSLRQFQPSAGNRPSVRHDTQIKTTMT